MRERIGTDVKIALNLGILSARGTRAIQRIDNGVYSARVLFRGVGDWVSEKISKRQARLFDSTLQDILTVSQRLTEQKIGSAPSFLLGDYSYMRSRYKIWFSAAGLEKYKINEQSVPTVAIRFADGDYYHEKSRVFAFDPSSNSFRDFDNHDIVMSEYLEQHHVDLNKMRKKFLKNFRSRVAHIHER